MKNKLSELGHCVNQSSCQQDISLSSLLKLKYKIPMFAIASSVSLMLNQAGYGQFKKPHEIAGMYGQNGYGVALDIMGKYPQLKGPSLIAQWSELQTNNIENTSSSIYNNLFDNTLINLKPGQFTYLKTWYAGVHRVPLYVYFGPKPATLYSHLEVKPNTYSYDFNGFGSLIKDPTSDIGFYPDFFHVNYRLHFNNEMARQCNYINSLTDTLRNKIAFVQATSGSTGDEGGNKSDLIYKYDQNGISSSSGIPTTHFKISEQWKQFRFDSWDFMLKRLIKDGQQTMPICINIMDLNDATTFFGLINAAYPAQSTPKYAWIKEGALTHGYHVNNEQTTLNQLNEVRAAARASNIILGVRGEMADSIGNYKSHNPKQSYYWATLLALHSGIEMMNLNTQNMKDLPSYDDQVLPAVTIMNKYANQYDAKTARRGFCALRAGVDIVNTTLFPVDIYGVYNDKTINSITNVNRIDNILKNFYHKDNYFKGQHLDGYPRNLDPADQLLSGVASRKRVRENDVGFNLIQSNFQQNVYQLNADTTSTAFWQIGVQGVPTDPIHITETTGSMEDRCARGFKNYVTPMTFKLVPEFAKTAKDVKITVTYRNKDAGSWAVSIGGGTKVKVTNTGGGAIWSKAVFTGSLAGTNKNIVLTNESIKNSSIQLPRFHMIEVEKLN